MLKLVPTRMLLKKKKPAERLWYEDIAIQSTTTKLHKSLHPLCSLC